MTTRPWMIFGCTGQDGRYVAERLSATGIAVVGVTRSEAEAADRALAGFRRHFASLVTGFDAGFEATLAAIERVEPAVVVNVAGLSSVGYSFAHPLEIINGGQNLNVFVLESLRRLGSPARYVFASSGEVFGETGAAGAGPACPHAPRSPYGVSKSSSSMLVRVYREAYGVDACSAFLFPHESPLRPPGFALPTIARGIVALARRATDRLPVGDVDVVRDWGWAPEYADALVAMGRHGRAADAIVATGRGVRLRDLIRHGLARYGIEEDCLTVDAGRLRPGEIRRSVGDVAASAGMLGWQAQVHGTAVMDRLLDHFERA